LSKPFGKAKIISCFLVAKPFYDYAVAQSFCFQG